MSFDAWAQRRPPVPIVNEWTAADQARLDAHTAEAQERAAHVRRHEQFAMKGHQVTLIPDPKGGKPKKEFGPVSHRGFTSESERYDRVLAQYPEGIRV